MSWRTLLPLRLLLGAALLAAASGATASGTVTYNTSVLSTREAYIIVRSRHTRTLVVNVDYEITCQDGTRRLRVIGHDGLGAGHVIQLPAASICDIVGLRVINLRWDLIPAEKSADERRALAEQLAREREAGRLAADEAERARKARCGIGPDGRWRDEDVAYGRIPLRCYSWYPALDAGAKRFAKEQARQAKERIDAANEAWARKAERQRLDAGMAAMRAQEQREINARQAAQDAKRTRAMSADEKSRHEISEYQRIADLHRNDPCLGVRVLSGLPPDLSSVSEGGSETLMRQKEREWDMQINLLDSQCRRTGDRAAAIARQQQAAAAEAERQRNIQNARIELEHANERGSAVVRQQAGQLQQQQDDTARLRDMLK